MESHREWETNDRRYLSERRLRFLTDYEASNEAVAGGFGIAYGRSTDQHGMMKITPARGRRHLFRQAKGMGEVELHYNHLWGHTPAEPGPTRVRFGAKCWHSRWALW